MRSCIGSPDDVQFEKELSARRYEPAREGGPNHIRGKTRRGSLDVKVHSTDDLPLIDVSRAGFAMEIRIPVVPATDQLEEGPRAERTESIVAKAPNCAIAGAHHLGAKCQPAIPELRFATAALPPLRQRAGLEAAGAAELELIDERHVKGNAADGRFLIVLIGVVLTLTHLVEQPELVLDRA